MMRATFFEKFELFANTPEAVGKLRELVLEQAVRGRLVKRTLGDEPVESLLGRIWAGRGTGRSERKPSMPGPFDLPSHWRWASLAEIVDFTIGKTPPRGDARYWHPGDHAWVSIADMSHYGTVTDTKERVSALAADEIFRGRFAGPGSILMSFKLTIGKVARTAVACFHNEAIVSIKPPEPELGDYLFRFLPMFARLQTANGAVKGSTLNKGLLESIPVALPPLGEQGRIVEIVNELMALCDRLEAQQREREKCRDRLAQASLARFANAPTPANLNFLFHDSYAIDPADLRRSLTELAIQGKLLSQHAAQHPIGVAASLVERDSPTASTRPPFPVPASWRWVRIADLRPDFQNGISSRGDRDGVPVVVIRLADVTGRRLSFQGTREIPITPSQIPKYTLHRGDILITRVNGSADLVGTFVPVEGDLPAIYCDHFIRMRLDSKIVDSQFLTLVGSSRVVRDQIAGLFVSTAGQKTVNQEHIRSLSFPLPPLSDQRRIVAKVFELMLRVDRLDALSAAAHAAGERLAGALVAELTAMG